MVSDVVSNVVVEQSSCSDAELVTVPVVLFEVGFKLDKVPVAGGGVHDGKTAVAVALVFVLSSIAVMDVVTSVASWDGAAVLVVVAAFA